MTNNQNNPIEMREAFEKWAKLRYYPQEIQDKQKNGNYAIAVVYSDWLVWQAAWQQTHKFNVETHKQNISGAASSSSAMNSYLETPSNGDAGNPASAGHKPNQRGEG